MSPDELERQHRVLRVSFLVAACALLCVLWLVVIRSGQAPWRGLQERFLGQYAEGEAVDRGVAIRQYFTCAGQIDRCPSCHLGMGRADLAEARVPLPFRAHGPGLGGHPPDRIGCSACHGGVGRALDPLVAHGLAGGERPDPLMREPHIQASCARCHVPGAQPGQERLEQGAMLYLGLGCMLCHPLTDGGRGGLDFGPDLTMIGRKGLDYLKTSLIEPTHNFPGSTMPSFRLSLEQEPEATESLLIYLESLVLDRYPECGTREKSRSLVLRPCSTCHAGRAGVASGRMEHRCTYIRRKSGELRCGICHAPGVPPAGPGAGFCPLMKQHRESCSACHDGAESGIPANDDIPANGDIPSNADIQERSGEGKPPAAPFTRSSLHGERHRARGLLRPFDKGFAICAIEGHCGEPQATRQAPGTVRPRHRPPRRSGSRNDGMYTQGDARSLGRTGGRLTGHPEDRERRASGAG